jgi:hypothetical protein
MKRVRLAAWREEEGRTRAEELAGTGWDVVFDPVDAGRLLGMLKRDPPDAVIIDLTRSPAQGRDLGVALRVHSATRRVSLLFAGGVPEKVEGVRGILPDAMYSDWEGLKADLAKALAEPPENPIVPDSMLAGYSGTPLPRKLGIKEGNRVLLVRGPEEFERTLGPLPNGARLVTRYSPGVDLILWFVTSAAELERGISKWRGRVGKGGIWIIWPKKASGLSSDLSQNLVRKVGLDAGLVDYKIAAVDATWSGLKFALRKTPSRG